MALILSDLIRTMQTYFRFGTLRIKDNSGTMQSRNGADSAYADFAAKKLRVQGNNATNAVVWDVPNGLAGTVTLTLPATAGSSNQFLQTDGSGTLSWATASTNSSNIEFGTFTEATSSPLSAIISPPANSSLIEVAIEVVSAAAAGNPTVSVGKISDPDLYVLTTDVDLLSTGIYVVRTAAELGAVPDDIIITITPDSQTFSCEYYLTYSVVS